MNAALSEPGREDEVKSKIRKVRAFGRNARVVTLLVGVWSGFSIVLVLAVLVFFLFTRGETPNVEGNVGGAFRVLQALLTPMQLAMTISLTLVIAGAIWLAALRQLHRLFTKLAAGEIYTRDNVGCLRNLGLLLLLSAALGVVIPTAVVVARNLLDASVPIDFDRIYPSLSELFWSFATAGLILLASWIMDVGLYVKDHADALQRDAELTI